MDQKKQLLEMVMDSQLPGEIKTGIASYLAGVSEVNDEVKENVATVFEVFAEVEQSLADNTKGIVTLEEQIMERLKRIDDETENKLQAIIAEMEPKVEELKQKMMDSVGGTSTAEESATTETPTVTSTPDTASDMGGLPPVESPSMDAPTETATDLPTMGQENDQQEEAVASPSEETGQDEAANDQPISGI